MESKISAVVSVKGKEIKLEAYDYIDDREYDFINRCGRINAFFRSLEMDTVKELGIDIMVYQRALGRINNV